MSACLKESSENEVWVGWKPVLSSAIPASSASCWQPQKNRLAFREMRLHVRGLIEYSNQCRRDCLYCGLRVSNRSLERYHLQAEEIIELGLAIYRRDNLYSLAGRENSSDREVERIAG